MKTITSICIIAVAAMGVLRAQCSYLELSTDSSTGKVFCVLEPEFYTEGIQITLSRFGDDVALRLHLWSGYKLQCFEPGDKLVLFLSNDNGAELQNSQSACGEFIEHHDQQFHLYQLEYWMKGEILKLLRETEIVLIQVFRGKEHLAFRPDSEHVTSFVRRNYECVYPE